MLRSIGKQSGEFVESVLKCQRITHWSKIHRFEIGTREFRQTDRRTVLKHFSRLLGFVAPY